MAQLLAGVTACNYAVSVCSMVLVHGKSAYVQHDILAKPKNAVMRPNVPAAG